jgi:hypothetical protein
MSKAKAVVHLLCPVCLSPDGLFKAGATKIDSDCRDTRTGAEVEILSGSSITCQCCGAKGKALLD